MTETQGLGRIERIDDLREAWPHESNDFTPWLAEHISELGNALGLEIELQEQEAQVGTFYLDLLARESVTDRTVIIENQLEPTNHDHLGKLLTYAGGFDANVIVWVAKDFRDEHRQSLDWLNQRTDEDSEFFGVSVELWKIGDSLPAPHFKVVSAPNEWQRETKHSVQDANKSDKNRRYQAFFQELTDALTQQDFTKRRKARPQSWLWFSAGHGGRVQYTAVFGHRKTARVGVYIRHTDQEWNKELFDQLEEEKEAIESELKESLVWQRLDHRTASRISAQRQGSIDDEEALEETRNWMIEKLVDFKRVFGPRLDELAR
ncbi:MAG: DUF4268 domain-containing protein [Nitrospinae bacterium]|nr:DUF4268 domain-containing protein [Nitrospinota bacterium]